MTGTAHFPGGLWSLTTFFAYFPWNPASRYASFGGTSRRTRTHICCFGDSGPAIERETHRSRRGLTPPLTFQVWSLAWPWCGYGDSDPG
jgi:hypothetical protein